MKFEAEVIEHWLQIIRKGLQSPSSGIFWTLVMVLLSTVARLVTGPRVYLKEMISLYKCFLKLELGCHVGKRLLMR